MTAIRNRVIYADRVPRSRRRWMLVTGGLVVLAVVGLLFWIGVRTAQAQHRLSHANARVAALHQHLLAGDDAAAASDLAVIQRDTRRARSLTRGFVFATASDVPYLGRTPRAVRVLARGVDDFAHTPLPALVRAGDALSATKLRSSNGSFDLAALSNVGEALTAVQPELVSIRTDLLRAPRGVMVLDPVDKARSALVGAVDDISAHVAVASRFAAVGPAMLGGQGTRRYLIVVQNNNEARGTGGIADAIAEATAQRGQLRLVGAAAIARSPHAQAWQQANLSPDFPTAARAWAGLWAGDHRGQPVDGVIGVDPLTFGHVLTATGALHLGKPPGQQKTLTAADIARESEVRYATIQQPVVRDRALALVTGALLRNVFTGSGDSKLLGLQLSRAAEEGHVQIWSQHPEEESVLLATSYGGALSTLASPFAEAVVNNLSGNKLDFFLDRSLTYFAGSCGGRNRSTTIDVRLESKVEQQLPAYLFVRSDHPSARAPKGQSRVRLSVFTTAGSRLTAATLDGQPVAVDTSVEQGHPVFSLDLSLQPHVPLHLQLRLVEPTLNGDPIVPVQPLVRPQQNDVSVPVCR